MPRAAAASAAGWNLPTFSAFHTQLHQGTSHSQGLFSLSYRFIVHYILLVLSAFVWPTYFSRDYSRLGRVLHRSSEEEPAGFAVKSHTYTHISLMVIFQVNLIIIHERFRCDLLLAGPFLMPASRNVQDFIFSSSIMLSIFWKESKLWKYSVLYTAHVLIFTRYIQCCSSSLACNGQW